MTDYTFSLQSPEIKTNFEWQLYQELNVLDGDQLIAKVELELLTINKHRNALQSCEALEELGATDWELPLNLFFKGHNVKADLSEQLSVKQESKKATQHIMLEAISVLPAYQGKGVGKAILNYLANEYSKAQSIWLMAMPMHFFIDPEECELAEDKAYYQAMKLTEQTATSSEISAYFQKQGFQSLSIDENLLAELLPYKILVTSPKLLADNE
ncbi:GNAT family N-acetyltransferase [Thalassotalea euphylliae]|uniref:N-acetyltransferase n=1 Tax=Thalassotalea euphylliae TaxID=1655234 RepID=A0A3E0TXR5_9GAMM|nr:GNAT family N-acetyltransferase [Thalassotalea euphylliae]REL29436.1 N-acetyltransferase [Thalassotalea euphylliae]